jgi:hypothetical protein
MWETEDTQVSPSDGQTLFHKNAYGRMRYAHDVIEIGPGSYVGTVEGPVQAAAADGVRVVWTFLTPERHSFSIRTYRGLLDARCGPGGLEE